MVSSHVDDIWSVFVSAEFTVLWHHKELQYEYSSLVYVTTWKSQQLSFRWKSRVVFNLWRAIRARYTRCQMVVDPWPSTIRPISSARGRLALWIHVGVRRQPRWNAIIRTSFRGGLCSLIRAIHFARTNVWRVVTH